MNLQELEARLRTLIEVRLISALPGQKAEDLLVHRLTDAMHSGAVPDAKGRQVAPNLYTVLAHPSSVSYWKNRDLLDTLVDILEAAAQEASLHFEIAPSISIAEDPSLRPGDFSLIPSFRANSLAETKDMKTDTGNTMAEESGDGIPENAFLIVEGVKTFQLTAAVVNIGRRLDNTLVVDDPRVSRNHAQLRAIKGRYVLFDLESTGGTFVNGQRANQSVLYPGDVISLAGVSLIFGQDVPVARKDIDDTAPRSEAGADRSTAVIHPSHLFPKKDK